MMGSRARQMVAGIAVVLVVTACPDGTSPPAVASVQMTTTYLNPRVGEISNITAKAVNDGGVEVPGVTCTFASGTPAVAAIDANSGVATALSVGTSVITATCGPKNGTLTLTVRPREFTLTITKTGAGNGAVFTTPAGTAFDEGTVVSATATANAGSTFNGWGGACTGKAQPCAITMNANRTLTADFSDGEPFSLSTAFGGNMTSVSDPAPPGCSYSVSIQVTSLSLLIKATSASGTAVSTIGVAASGQTGAGSCTGNPFQENAAGNLTVNGNSITGTLVFFSQTRSKNTHVLTINATRNNTTITGTLSITQNLYNNVGAEFTSTGGPYNFTLNKVP